MNESDRDRFESILLLVARYIHPNDWNATATLVNTHFGTMRTASGQILPPVTGPTLIPQYRNIRPGHKLYDIYVGKDEYSEEAQNGLRSMNLMDAYIASKNA